MSELGELELRPSGRFVLRIDPQLHASLKVEARDAGLSLNEYCARRLAAPPGALDTCEDAARVVSHAIELYRDSLCGVAIFGSWARGEAGDGSDVDILVVVGSDVRIARAVYRDWDRQPLRWDGRRVEVHLARLPEGKNQLSGLWAEIALHCIVIYDRDFQLARYLAVVRDQLILGSLVRKTAAGQPYWVEVAVSEEF